MATGSVLSLIVGLVVIIIAAAITNLVYTQVMASMPADSTPLFDISAMASAANLITPLVILIIAGAMIGFLVNLARGFQ